MALDRVAALPAEAVPLRRRAGGSSPSRSPPRTPPGLRQLGDGRVRGPRGRHRGRRRGARAGCRSSTSPAPVIPPTPSSAGRGDRDLHRRRAAGGRRRGRPGRGREPRGNDRSTSRRGRRGTAVRRAGEDVRAGDPSCEPGIPLGAAELGALAAVGHAELACARRRGSSSSPATSSSSPARRSARGRSATRTPRRPAAGRGRRRRGRGTASMRRRPRRHPRCPRAALDGDVAVVSGGVSVGDHDHVRPALDSLGVEQVFWGVSLRPGKPTYFGVAPGGRSSSPSPATRFRRWSPSCSSSAPPAADAGSRPAHPRATALSTATTRRSGRAEAIRVGLRRRRRLGRDADRPAGLHVLTSMSAPTASHRRERGDVRAGEPIEVELLRPR